MNYLGKNSFYWKSVLVGFIVSIILFVLLNIYEMHTKGWFVIEESYAFDEYYQIGTPFAFYEYGSILHLNNMIWYGVIVNIFLLMCSSFLVGHLLYFLKRTFKT